jgi:hypothetical protein
MCAIHNKQTPGLARCDNGFPANRAYSIPRLGLHCRVDTFVRATWCSAAEAMERCAAGRWNRKDPRELASQTTVPKMAADISKLQTLIQIVQARHIQPLCPSQRRADASVPTRRLATHIQNDITAGHIRASDQGRACKFCCSLQLQLQLQRHRMRCAPGTRSSNTRSWLHCKAVNRSRVQQARRFSARTA